VKLSAGSLVADRFEIVRFIAEGGMGEVYEAKDRVLGEHVALKFLSHRNVGDDQIARRFRREIQLARKVTHPNVCRLFDVYFHEVEVPGIPHEKARIAFVTMELLDGDTLESYVQKRGRLSEDEALAIVVQMCRALDAAHAAGIVHRDFKSNNVMLVRDRRQSQPATEAEGGERPGDFRVVVTDFGLARSTDDQQSSSTRSPLTVDQLIIGTADYMAPEQIHGEAVSPQSDLYALGVVMFEMITGRKPYSAPNAMQLLVKRINEKPARPRDFVPTISHLWESTILRCLETDPKDRPLSAREVLRELEATTTFDAESLGSDLHQRAASGEARRAGTATTVIAPVPARGWRHPGLWLGALALLLVALVLLFRDGERPAGQGVFRPSRLTTGPGLELDPVFSPNGQEVAWSGELQNGRFEIFVQRLGSGAPPRQLTLDDGAAFEPDWSPDGSRIVYHSRRRGGLWTTTPQGASPEQLTTDGSRPAFSPDGRYLVYQSESAPLVADTAAPAIVPSHLFLLDLETKQNRPLTTSGQPDGGHGAPCFTPDGKHVVFSTSYRARSEIWAVEVETGTLRPLVKSPAAAYDPVVSPDGKRLYFSALSSEVKDLWELEISEGLTEIGTPRLVAGLGVSSLRSPAISKDGKQLVFAAYSTRSNLWQLAIDPRDGAPLGEAKALTYGDDRYSRPSFSPDGKTLAYDFWKTGVKIDVNLMDWKSGERRQALRSQASTSHASWLADGRLGLSSWDEKTRSYLLLDPAGGAEAPLEELPKDADWAFMSRDGQRLAYHTRGQGTSLNVWLRDLAAKTPARQVTFHENLAGFPIFSHDGKWIAYQVRQGDDTQLWQLEISTGLARQLTFDPGASWPFSYFPDDSRIAFAGLRDGLWNLYWIAPGSLEQKALTLSSSLTSYLRYPTFTPDGKTLVYEKAESSGDLFVVDRFL
jgi:serine/threonine protein kinase/Tol biopolymer transport system component